VIFLLGFYGDVVQKATSSSPKSGKNRISIIESLYRTEQRQKANEMADLAPTIVIDNGSGMIKAGFAGEPEPSAVFTSLIGFPKYTSVIFDKRPHKGFYFAEEAQLHRGVLSLHYPMENAVVTNWEYMTKIWDYTFSKRLRAEPSEHPVLLTDAPLAPRSNREKMAEVMFENFQVPTMYVATQAILSLYAANSLTGLVVDSGDGVTHIVPVYEGYAIPHAIQRIHLAGRNLTAYLGRLLAERGYSFVGGAEREIVSDIKEKLCYVCPTVYRERGTEPAQWTPNSYELPDGRMITLGSERVRCPEALFQPHLLGLECPGITEAAFQSVMHSEIDLRKTFFSHVLLTGGSTLFPGIEERFKNDLTQFISTTTTIRNSDVHVRAPEDRRHTVWIGGSILATLKAFQSMWVTKQMYEEHGSRVVHKCL
jgi:actin-related protein